MDNLTPYISLFLKQGNKQPNCDSQLAETGKCLGSNFSEKGISILGKYPGDCPGVSWKVLEKNVRE